MKEFLGDGVWVDWDPNIKMMTITVESIAEVYNAIHLVGPVLANLEGYMKRNSIL
jgi:hypothetical protein